MAYNPSLFNINPYYDDYDTSKGFLRVLFKPGYALQARELTQLQSILQNQVSKISDHLFKDGSRVAGGGISVRNADYLMVRANSGTAVVGISDYSSLIDGILTDTNQKTEARIVHVVPPDNQLDGHVVLILDYVSGSQFTSTTLNYTKGQSSGTMVIVSASDSDMVLAKASPNGKCKLITVSEGIFYVDGFFVQTPVQKFAPYTLLSTIRDYNFGGFSRLTKKIGFTVTRDAVTEVEDPSLRDPAIGSYNYNAPGADRYTINLSLSQAETDVTPNDFIELLRFESGRITKKVERITYGEIERALARRTYDESGSYVVRPFDLSVKSAASGNASDSILKMNIGSGKAYVFGHEVENQYPVSLSFSAARTTQTETGVELYTQVGNYSSVVLNGFSAEFNTNQIALSNGSLLAQFRNASGAVVATAYSHSLFPFPTNAASSRYTAYFYGISGSPYTATALNLYRNDLAFGAAGRTVGSFTPLSGTNFQITDTENQKLVFEIQPGYAVDEVSSMSFWTKMTSKPLTTTVSISGSNTVYTITKSDFSDTIASGDSSVFSFFNYNHTPSALDNKLVPVFTLSAGNDTAKAWSPISSTGSIVRSTDGGTVTVTVPTNSVPSGWGAGGQPRVTMPIRYLPTIGSVGTYRYKTSATTTNTFTAGSGRKTDENGRFYYELDKTDVYSVVSVIGPSNVSYTEDFEVDGGQRHSHYDRGRLYLKRTAETKPQYSSTSTTPFTVSFKYFNHAGLAAAPFIGKHSYLHSGSGDFTYAQIPLYTDMRTGKTVSLANCLDFRRNGITSNTAILKPFGVNELPAQNGTVSVNHSHYLPRIDKLCVKSDPDDGSALFFFVSGTPDLAPVAPPDPDDAIVIATVTVPAYTHNPGDVVVTPVENRRYTMGEIGKIQKRLDDVEVFSKLSISEAEIESRTLRGSSAEAEPFKTSIFSDEFYGHSVADVVDGNHFCSVDYERGELRPFFRASRPVTTAPSYNGTTASSDGLVTLEYTTVPYIENKQYTKTVKINPSNTINWLGYMKLSPSVDPFYDTVRPVVKSNALMENDNWLSSNALNNSGHGTQWNDWESIWTGIEFVEEEQDDVQKRVLEVPHVSSDSAVTSITSGNVKTGTSRFVDTITKKISNFMNAKRLKNRIKQKIGSREIDRTVVPYIPQKSVTAVVQGLKPNDSGLSLFFDGDSSALVTGISTDSNGNCTVEFDINPSTYSVGVKTVRITDSGVLENASVSAETSYICSGLLEQRDSGSYSVRLPDYRRQIPSSETISKDPFNRDTDVIDGNQWSDPLSQTFFVDKKTNPEGVYISSVSLYFSSKDTGVTASVPVALQIRPTVSGYPSPSVVIPFSTVVKSANEVNANAEQPTETVFAFSSPVYLEPGEYAICVNANSDKYELFAAQATVNAIENNDAVSGRAGNNQLVGTLYTTQGVGPAVPDNSTDLMFAVNRCDFDSTGNFSWSALSGGANSQIFKFYAPEIIPNGCAITRIFNNSFDFKNNETLYPTSAVSSNPALSYTFDRGINRSVSPALYISAMYSAAVSMHESDTNRNSRYVSRVVELPTGLLSNGVSVFVDVNKPAETGIAVYYRYSMNGESDIFTKPWIEMTSPLTNFNSSSEIDFREMVWSGGTSTSPLFKSYQIRVDLYTHVRNPTPFTYYQTPAVKSIRAVSWVK